MAVFALEAHNIIFPPIHLAEPDGLLAIGGDLSPERLIEAYKKGIFPWYEGKVIQWWSPAPRFVLFPDNLKISKSTRQILNKNSFRFTTNTAFADVIYNCKTSYRNKQEIQGTWITDEVEKAYCKLHEMGIAHSAEVWQNNELVGGLYGLRIGNVYFGESMFSKVSNASKIAFTQYVQQLKKENVGLIDCQIYSEYLESLGAEMIPRPTFLNFLQKLL